MLPAVKAIESLELRLDTRSFNASFGMETRSVFRVSKPTAMKRLKHLAEGNGKVCVKHLNIDSHSVKLR